MKLFLKITLLALAFSKIAGAQSFKILPLASGKNTSIRGISVVDKQVAWVSGSNGWIAKTINGKDFEWWQISGYEKIDFRDIEAFSDQDAIILSAGSPAYIFKTMDGGKSWEKKYENNDSNIFLDGMDFWNAKEGIAFGDPINGIMQLLMTKDGGETWENISDKTNIRLNDGEAGFAASGTGIKVVKNKVYIATGGTFSRLFTSTDKGITWKSEDLPLIHGRSSTGCFSIDVFKNKLFAVGGDYLQDENSSKNYTLKNQGEWTQATVPPFGYKSCIVGINDKVVLTTGTSGTDLSVDGGKTFSNLSKEGFHVCKKAKKGKLILLAGSEGRIACLSNKLLK
ncbi:MAG: oxidoreductase [Sphingobacteriales bacterium]|nr:oxidoreductase [Sphingobacteriales bacterium]